MSQLTIVMGYRDREAERIERCLKSLAEQTFQDFEVMFVDYGSQTAFAHPTEEMLRRFTFVKYIYSDTRGQPWNRSRALNIGGRMAKSAYLMTTDVDMIFPPDFLNVVMENAGAKKVLYCVPHFMTEGFKDWNHIEDYEGKFPSGGAGHKGGCQLMPTPIFHDIRGFDETYQYWGTEDADMNKRLLGLGFKEQWLNDQIHFFHQWHPAGRHITPGFLPFGEWGRIQIHYYQHFGETVRNDPEWGGVLKQEDRPISTIIDIDHAMIRKEANVKILDLDPNDNNSLNIVLSTFWKLSSGQALAVKHAWYPQRAGWSNQLVALGNLLARALKTDMGFDYAPNLLHAFISEFISQKNPIVADYYLGFPAMGGISVLMHS